MAPAPGGLAGPACRTISRRWNSSESEWPSSTCGGETHSTDTEREREKGGPKLWANFKTLTGIFGQNSGPTCEFWANTANFAFKLAILAPGMLSLQLSLPTKNFVQQKCLGPQEQFLGPESAGRAAHGVLAAHALAGLRVDPRHHLRSHGQCTCMQTFSGGPPHNYGSPQTRRSSL
jgi:hypothetical protein